MVDSETLARGERLHTEAVSEHNAALDKHNGINARLKDAATRMSAITKRRIDGESNDQETAEFAALSGDVALLEKMLATAKKETDLAFGKVHSVFVEFDEAKQMLARQQAQMEYNALLATAKDVESVFCQAIRAVGLAGRKIGHHVLSQSFTRSDVLHRAIDLGCLPPQE